MRLLLAYLFCLFIAVAPVLGCLGPKDEATLSAKAQIELAPAVEAEEDAGAAAKAALEALLAAQTPEELDAAKRDLEEANATLASAVADRKAAEASLAEKERELREINGRGFLGFATAFWPQLAAVAPVAAAGIGAAAGLFSPRWREHAGKALKSLVPADGRMDVGAFMVSVAKAYGLAHTSSDPAELADVVDELVTKKTALSPDEKAVLLAKLEALRSKVDASPAPIAA